MAIGGKRYSMDNQEDIDLVTVQDRRRGRVERLKSKQLVEVKEQVQMLLADFHTLNSRQQFLARRYLFDQLLKRFKECHRRDLKAMKSMRDASFKFKGLGQVPGVNIGDSFDYRAEMYVVGLHGADQKGISTIMQGGKRIACSVVVSGGYKDNVDRGDEIIYSGEGGRGERGVQKKDQELTGGNMALVNSCKYETPVRVIRGHACGRIVQRMHSLNMGKNIKKAYSYDGLYIVSDWKLEKGSNEYKVFKFTLTQA